MTRDSIIKRVIAWLLEDTSPQAPQPIRPERLIMATISDRTDRVTAREWIGVGKARPGV
jgi:hypothetical protein